MTDVEIIEQVTDFDSSNSENISTTNINEFITKDLFDTLYNTYT